MAQRNDLGMVEESTYAIRTPIGRSRDTNLFHSPEDGYYVQCKRCGAKRPVVVDSNGNPTNWNWKRCFRKH